MDRVESQETKYKLFSSSTLEAASSLCLSCWTVIASHHRYRLAEVRARATVRACSSPRRVPRPLAARHYFASSRKVSVLDWTTAFAAGTRNFHMVQLVTRGVWRGTGGASVWNVGEVCFSFFAWKERDARSWRLSSSATPPPLSESKTNSREPRLEGRQQLVYRLYRYNTLSLTWLPCGGTAQKSSIDCVVTILRMLVSQEYSFVD